MRGFARQRIDYRTGDRSTWKQEKENSRLKKLVADISMDNAILKTTPKFEHYYLLGHFATSLLILINHI